MKILHLLLTTGILSTCASAVQAQQLRYTTSGLTIKRNGDFLTATDASGRHLANVDLTKPAVKGKVIAFVYSSKKKKTNYEAVETIAHLTLFPNPTSKQVQLDLRGPWTFPVEVQILDQRGNILQSDRLETENHSLNIASLKQGVYILKAESGSSKAVEKLVVH